MNTKKWSVLLLIFLLGSSQLVAQDIREYRVKKIDSQLTIDGNLNENGWNSVNPTENFVVLGNDQTAPQTATWAKLLWDEEYLYVGFYCEDLNIWATYQNRDDQLWQEDAVEIYIDSDGDGEKYIEFEVNPINTIFDLWLTKPWSEGGFGHPEFNFQAFSTETRIQGTVVNTSDLDTAWTCEVALPFSEMQFAAISMNYPPLENEIWRFNLFRFDRDRKNDPNAEETGWNQTGGGQHVPDKFGKIIFSGEGPTLIASAQIPHSPNQFTLYQNYPNPFNPTTVIKFHLPLSSDVNLKIMNLAGQEIETLFQGYHTAGEYEVTWSVKDCPSGVYMYQLQTGDYYQTKKLIIQK